MSSKNISPLEILQLSNLSILKLTIGIELGIVYAFIALLLIKAPIFEGIPYRIENIIKKMWGNYGRILSEYPHIPSFRKGNLDKYIKIERYLLNLSIWPVLG